MEEAAMANRDVNMETNHEKWMKSWIQVKITRESRQIEVSVQK